MKELIEKLKKYNAWRRSGETLPQPHPQEVGEMIDQAVEALERGSGLLQYCGLRVLNDELSLQAVGWNDVRLLLSKVQLLVVQHGLKWVDVEHKGFTMLVEPGSDIELLAAEFEEWKNERRAKNEV